MKITIRKFAEKYIRRLEPKQQARILTAIYKLPEGDVKALNGTEYGFRLRVGDWRIVYDYDGNEIVVYEIGGRGDIYK